MLESMKQILKVWNKNLFGEIISMCKKNESMDQNLLEELDVGPTGQLHYDLSAAKASLHNWLQIRRLTNIKNHKSIGRMKEIGTMLCTMHMLSQEVLQIVLTRSKLTVPLSKTLFKFSILLPVPLLTTDRLAS